MSTVHPCGRFSEFMVFFGVATTRRPLIFRALQRRDHTFENSPYVHIPRGHCIRGLPRACLLSRQPVRQQLRLAFMRAGHVQQQVAVPASGNGRVKKGLFRQTPLRCSWPVTPEGRDHQALLKAAPHAPARAKPAAVSSHYVASEERQGAPKKSGPERSGRPQPIENQQNTIHQPQGSEKGRLFWIAANFLTAEGAREHCKQSTRWKLSEGGWGKH